MYVNPSTKSLNIANRDLKINPVWLHFLPVFLGLFCGFISLCGYSVYYGFSENEPATWLSLCLLFWGLLLNINAIGDTRNQPVIRRIAFVLGAIYFAAILDEWLKGHEAIGYFVQDNIGFISPKILNYTDDVLILLAAITGIIILINSIKRIPDKTHYYKYIFIVAVLAILHGLLDISNHRHYLWQLFNPNASYRSMHFLLEVLGFFEETTKLWTEWFMILFLLRLYHRQSGRLRWQIQVTVGSYLMVAGIWAIAPGADQIPFLIANPMLHYIRNYHFWVILAMIAFTWTCIAWYRYQKDTQKRSLAGLFFVAPWYLLLPEMADSLTWVPGNGLNPIVLIWIIPASVIGLGLFFAPQNRWLWGLLILTGIIGISTSNILYQPALVFQAGGLVLPLMIYWLWQKRNWSMIILLVAALLVIQNPFWLVGGLGFAILVWIDQDWRIKFRWRNIFAIQLAAIALTLALFPPTWIDNEHFEPREKVMFETGYQDVFSRD